MKQFIKIELANKVSKNNETVEIFKFQKEGTNRIFFAPEFNGRRLTSTLFARLYDAKELAIVFLNRNK